MTPTAITQTAKEAAHLYGYKPSGVAKSITAFLKSNKDVDRIDAVNNLIGTDYYDDALQAFGYDLALVAAFDYDKYFSEERVKKTAQKVAVKVSKSKVIKEQKEPVHITKKLPAKLPVTPSKINKVAKVIPAKVSPIKPHSLNDIIKLASSIIPRRSTLAMLEYLRITDRNRTTVEATDLETFVRFNTDIHTDKVVKEKIVYVKSRALTSIKKIEDVWVTQGSIKVNNSHTFNEPTGNDHKLDLPSLAVEYEKEISEENAVTDFVSLPAETLRAMYDRLGHAISANEFRIAMMGLCLQNGVAYATDGHRLSKYRDDGITIDGDRNRIIADKTFAIAARVMQGAVSIHFVNNLVRFSDGTNEVYGRLIDELPPNYGAVIPRENSDNFSVDRKDFLQALKDVLPASDPDTKQVRFQLAKDTLMLLTDNADLGTSARIDLHVTGRERNNGAYVDDLLIGFNGNFIRECLQSFDCKRVTFSLSTPHREALITGENDHKDTLQLVMPVRLSS